MTAPIVVFVPGLGLGPESVEAVLRIARWTRVPQPS